MKKFWYIVSTSVLGFLLSMLVHAVVEILYLRMLENQGKTPVWSTVFGKLEALPLWLAAVLAVAGIAFGIWLGFTWWRIVYVEKRHWRLRQDKQTTDA